MYKKIRCIEEVRKTYNVEGNLLYRKKNDEGIFYNDGFKIGVFEIPQVHGDNNYKYIRDSLEVLIHKNLDRTSIRRKINPAVNTLYNGKGVAFFGDYSYIDTVFACYYDFIEGHQIEKLDIPTSYKGAYANERYILLFPREKGVFILDKSVNPMKIKYLDYDHLIHGGFHKIIGSQEGMFYFSTTNKYIFAIDLDSEKVAYSIPPESFHPFTKSEELTSSSTSWLNGLCFHKGEIVNLYKESYCRISVSHEDFKVVRQELSLEEKYHFNRPVASRSFYFEEDLVVAANTESGYVFAYDLNTQQVLWSEHVFTYEKRMFDSLMSFQSNGELIYVLDKSDTLHIYELQNK